MGILATNLFAQLPPRLPNYYKLESTTCPSPLYFAPKCHIPHLNFIEKRVFLKAKIKNGIEKSTAKQIIYIL